MTYADALAAYVRAETERAIIAFREAPQEIFPNPTGPVRENDKAEEAAKRAAEDFAACYLDMRALYDAAEGDHQDRMDASFGCAPDRWLRGGWDALPVLDAVWDVFEERVAA